MIKTGDGNAMANIIQALASHVDVIRGIDISTSMANLFNASVTNAGISSEEMSAAVGNLLTPTPNIATPEHFNFDIAVLSMGLHHMSSPKELIVKLVERIRPGGVVAVLDWTPALEGFTFREAELDAAATINQTAIISPVVMFDMFEEAGCDPKTSFYLVLGEKSHISEEACKVKGGVDKNMFLAFSKKALVAKSASVAKVQPCCQSRVA
jgi:SAM-dependent methyltransferase